jgi:uncharacterized protein with HEPN domain
MRPDDEIRLRHLTEAASKAVGYCADRQRADLDSDELLRLALTKLVEIVGEAAKHISLEHCKPPNPVCPGLPPHACVTDLFTTTLM